METQMAAVIPEYIESQDPRTVTMEFAGQGVAVISHFQVRLRCCGVRGSRSRRVYMSTGPLGWGGTGAMRMGGVFNGTGRGMRHGHGLGLGHGHGHGHGRGLGHGHGHGHGRGLGHGHGRGHGCWSGHARFRIPLLMSSCSLVPSAERQRALWIMTAGYSCPTQTVMVWIVSPLTLRTPHKLNDGAVVQGLPPIPSRMFTNVYESEEDQYSTNIYEYLQILTHRGSGGFGQPRLLIGAE